jgi:hypothetical protein
MVSNFPKNFIEIVVTAKCKHYIKIISKKDHSTYQLSSPEGVTSNRVLDNLFYPIQLTNRLQINMNLAIIKSKKYSIKECVTRGLLPRFARQDIRIETNLSYRVGSQKAKYYCCGKRNYVINGIWLFAGEGALYNASPSPSCEIKRYCYKLSCFLPVHQQKGAKRLHVPLSSRIVPHHHLHAPLVK